MEDINVEDCSAIVNGKGTKQREIYFTTECKIWIKRFYPHRFRHTYACQLLDNGAPLEFIQGSPYETEKIVR
ncbi:hypothetical protein FE784_24630 [Paenibacillus hemerocallicola]|uniref:Tyr recombinase domain-containing protein n=1 Tax=Paenibacillus hemerocallicola TaxID=1172614 RepID=A0A5C4T4M4_9BACL|nr:hypothetical protein FE784_24630 [Paenibacillus hemerocallicola]